MMSDSERESMEFDVVIVGAAGGARRDPPEAGQSELSVVVLEKGSEVGAHILSGAVVDPIGIDRLLPGWRDERRPSVQDAGHRRPLPDALASPARSACPIS